MKLLFIYVVFIHVTCVVRGTNLMCRHTFDDGVDTFYNSPFITPLLAHGKTNNLTLSLF